MGKSGFFILINVLSKFELTYIIQALGGIVDDTQLESLVHALDSDGSNDLDIDELLVLMRNPSSNFFLTVYVFRVWFENCPMSFL